MALAQECGQTTVFCVGAELEPLLVVEHLGSTSLVTYHILVQSLNVANPFGVIAHNFCNRCDLQAQYLTTALDTSTTEQSKHM